MLDAIVTDECGKPLKGHIAPNFGFASVNTAFAIM